MRIKRLEAWRVSLKLREPYTIAYEEIDSAEQVFLQIHTDTGLIGWGSAAPDLHVTGETGEGVMQAFREVIEPALLGEEPLRIAFLLERLRPRLQKQPSARALVDIALHDLMGRIAGLPLYKLLGGFRESIVTSITIGILPIAQAVEKARLFVGRGFSSLKIKGGRDVEEDIERMAKIREAVGAGIALRFDANQGYTIEESVRFVRETTPLHLEMIEQPTPSERHDWLGEVAQRVHIPVMADESLLDLRDAFRLAKDDLTDMINIKLMKVGGLHDALHVNSVARAASLEAMVGCMDEVALSIAAGLHFALARPNVHYADLDGHFDFEDDPSEGTVILRDGVLYPRDAAGLGLCWKE